MSKEARTPPLEAGLLTAMQALDNQIARAMQRTPEQLNSHGVQKWEPYQQRIESIAAFLLDCMNNQSVELDSILILSQALPKALALLVADLGDTGLGKLRSDYCCAALKAIRKDAERASALLEDNMQTN